MAIQLLTPVERGVTALKGGNLSLSPPHDRDIDIHIGRKSVFLMSKALVTLLLAISFCVSLLSSLLSA